MQTFVVKSSQIALLLSVVEGVLNNLPEQTQ